MIKPTKLNLAKHGAKPLTAWLISAAQKRTYMTYGVAKERLEREHGFTTIFSPMMGNPAGQAMENIQDVFPDPRTDPDIRSLLVTETTLVPVLKNLAKKLGVRHLVVPQNR
jgi:hypothetical protein